MAEINFNSSVLHRILTFSLITGFTIGIGCPVGGVAVTAVPASTKQNLCNGNLEDKFLPKDGKCRYGGLLAVKGSCTAFIACIRFGGDLMKPLQQAECKKNFGQAFDIEFMRCAPVRDVKKCLQRDCYPEEAKMESSFADLREADGELHVYDHTQDESEVHSFPNPISNKTLMSITVRKSGNQTSISSAGQRIFYLFGYLGFLTLCNIINGVYYM